MNNNIIIAKDKGKVKDQEFCGFGCSAQVACKKHTKKKKTQKRTGCVKHSVTIVQ